MNYYSNKKFTVIYSNKWLVFFFSNMNKVDEFHKYLSFFYTSFFYTSFIYFFLYILQLKSYGYLLFQQ